MLSLQRFTEGDGELCMGSHQVPAYKCSGICWGRWPVLVCLTLISYRFNFLHFIVIIFAED